MSSSLIYFYRIDNQERAADLGEKIGNFGLGLLRIGFGRTIVVERMSDSLGGITFSEKKYSTCQRLSALVLFFLALPATILLACIGVIAISCSTSQRQMFNFYNDMNLPAKTLHLTPSVSSEENPILQENKPSEHLKVGSNRADNLYSKKRIKIDFSNKEVAATFIQKHARGYFARKSHLPSHLYSKYKSLCEEVNAFKWAKMPIATNGRTSVFLPKEIPEVALKHSGRGIAIKRFHQMQEVRAVLKQQKSSCLVIPRANLCKNFLVEQRLPVDGDFFYNTELYLLNHKLFDKAVSEFTRLFSKIHISDLVESNPHPLAHIPDAEDIVRYDNLPLYIVTKDGQQEGRLGLIDLERFVKKNEATLYSEELAKLVRIFPYHKEVIVQEALKLNVKIDMDLLNRAEMIGKKYLQAVFTDHLQWLKEKKISSKNSSVDFLGEGSIEEDRIIADIKDFLLENIFQDPHKDGVREAQTLASKMTYLILNNVRAEIKLHQQRILELKNSQSITSDSELVGFRSPALYRKNLYRGTDFCLARYQHRLLMQGKTDVEIAEIVTCRIMKTLKETGSLFSFDPGYYGGPDQYCWIRY